MLTTRLLSVLFAAIVSLVPVIANAQDAVYEITFEGRWLGPAPLPGNAHFTQIIGATHNSSGALYTVGQQASVGVEDVAELGVTTGLLSEIDAGIAAGNIDSTIEGTDTFITPQEVNTFTITANATHSRFTVLTMLAPSPDWFVGVNDLDLLDASGNWRDQIVSDLNSYDAGTENGTGLSLNNPATNPQSVITDLDTAEPSGILFGSGSVARLTLTRIVPNLLLGDVNEDGDLNFLDIAPFISILSAADYQLEADINEDRVVDFLDISPFIVLLSS